MNYSKYLILVYSLIANYSFASDARYYELKARYKRAQINAQEEKELAPIAAARRITRKIDPNSDPSEISRQLITVLAHPLFNKLYTVQVGTRTFQKCYLRAHKGSPEIIEWITNEVDRRRIRES